MSIPVIKRKLATNLKCHRTGAPDESSLSSRPVAREEPFPIDVIDALFCLFFSPLSPSLLTTFDGATG